MPAKKKANTSKANWGANERPRQCPKCSATESTVSSTRQLFSPDRTLRYRICDQCKQRFTTIDVK